MIIDLENLVKSHPTEKELLLQCGRGLANVISKCPVHDGLKYFTDVEKLFANADDVLSNLIRAKAAGNLLGCYGRYGKLDQARKLYDTKLAKLELGDDPSLPGVQARAIGNLITFYLRDGELQPATKMYKNDLTRLAKQYPDSDEVVQSYFFSSQALKGFGEL
jgi:hypothetical protein